MKANSRWAGLCPFGHFPIAPSDAADEFLLIKRFYIQNFRCIESLTLDFGEHSSALVIGNNGAGKSTIRLALAFLQRICRGSSRVGRLILPSDFSFNRTDRPMRFEIEAVLGNRLFIYKVSLDWPPAFREARILDESLSVEGQLVFERQQAQVTLPNEASFGLDWHVFALPVINERPPSRSVQELREFLASLILLAPIPSIMSGYSDRPTNELQGDAANFASCLRGLLEKKPSAYSPFDQFVKMVFPDFSAIENTSRGKEGTQLIVKFLRAGLDGQSEELALEFDALSDGEKCVFVSAYITASIAAGYPVFCFWDEPDNHIGLSVIGQLITSMRKSSQRGGQFIATSHHPEILRKFSDDTTLVLTRSSHLDPALVRPLKDIKYGVDLIHALIRNEIAECA